eukprot:TRINITY_DN8517_c0_g1_i1.p1 TRINITY_DN8517_c0_g1~~TRINITY_DN8517_c0_g1_i1.p1  ORF type:complete len:167 (+),score=19.92 TRINITY_DN8517_c0_g1_i1:84-584(+)
MGVYGKSLVLCFFASALCLCSALHFQAELAAYFTHCKLQPAHLKLSLQAAMAAGFKLKLFATTASICRRLLELNPTAAVATKVRKILAECERNPRDEAQLNYDPRNPFVVCGATYVPIYRGSRDSFCPYCGARFVPECAGSICAVCDLAVVGADASGLVCSMSQIR